MKRTGIKLFLGLVLIILFIFILDYILPVKIVEIKELSKKEIDFPENINSYFVSYDIYTSFSNLSTADKLDVLKGMDKNNISVSMVTDCNSGSSSLEGIYRDKVILSKCSVKNGNVNFSNFSVIPFGKEVKDLKPNQCKEILNFTKSLEFNITDFPKIFKFFIWYPFNKEKAYENLKSYAKIEESFTDYDPQKITCVLGGVGAYSRIKTANENGKNLILDFNYLLGMVKNKIYTTDILSMNLQKNKEIVFNALKNGNNIIYLTDKDFDMDIFVKGITKNYLLGNVVDLSEKPVIHLKVNGENLYTSVLLNGKVSSNYSAGSLKITPKNSSSYTFIVYRYKMRLPFNILLGVSPVAVTNPIYFQ